MKILFFSSYFYPYISGLTTYPRKILRTLAHKHQIKVLTFAHQNGLTAHEKFEGSEIIRLPYLFKISKGFISPQSIFYFLKHAKNTDILLLNIPNFEGLLLAIIAKLFRKKIIVIFHCEVDLGNNIFSLLINFFLNSSIFFQLFLSNIIVVYTKDYADHIWMLKLLRYKIQTILPPIEKLLVDGHFLRVLKSKKGRNIWIGFAGRVAKEKGLEYLIEAAVKLERHCVLVFAGPYGEDVVGEYQYYLKIKTLLEKSNFSHLFLGNLESGKLGAFYKSIDLLILPSFNKTEAFGMVQPEAMLLGTPVVATNLPGVRIPILLTKMGLLVEPKNPKQLSFAINKILNNRREFTNDTLIKNAAKILNIKQTYKFYEKLLARLNNIAISK